MRKVFVIYDSKTESYTNPFFDQATGAAVRHFTDEVNSGNPQSQIANHPEDFTLFEIGTYDESSCKLSIYEAKKSLGTGNDYRREEASNLKVAK